MSKKRFLAGFMGLLLLITSVYTGNVVVKAADEAGKVTVNFTGNGTLEYTFYDSEDAQCQAGIIRNDSNGSNSQSFDIPSDAVKMVLKASAAENWQTGSASGTKNDAEFSDMDNGIFGGAGKTIDVLNTDGFTINLTFTEHSQQPEAGTNTGDIAICVNNPVGSSAAYYRIGDDGDFTKINGSSITLRASSELNGVEQNTKIWFKADVDSSQVLDVNNQNWYRVGDAETPFVLEDLASGSAYIAYDPNNTYNVQIAFDGGNGGGEPGAEAGDIAICVNNPVGSSAAYYRIGDDGDFTKINGSSITLRATSELNGVEQNTKIWFKADVDSSQVLDANNQNWYRVGDAETPFVLEDLASGSAYIAYDPNNTYNVQIAFDGGNGGGEPGAEAGDIAICVNNPVGSSAAYYRIGDDGDFTKINGSSITLRATSELNGVEQNTKIWFKADVDSSQVLDANNQNWYRVGDQETPFVLEDLASGSAYIEYDSNNTYNVQIAFDGGNGGGEQQNVSFSCSSMNGNENERVEAVEVSLDGGSSWVNYSDGALNSLSEPTTFKVRIRMKSEDYTIDKVSLDYESFDHNSRVGYFKESAQPDYDAIIRALLSDGGYAITFQPEEDSKDAGGNSTLQANSTCLCLQYQTAIAYEASVAINWFFQTKDGDNGFGVWTIDENRQDVFVDGVGDSEVIFSFNDNNYGENGDPSALGYGKENNGENPIQVSYDSAYKNVTGKVTVTPKTYDYFSAGGYTTGTNNKIHLDDYDGLIDEVYIDLDHDNYFEASEKLTAKDGDDPNIGPYKYYEETLDAAASYNILVRKHKSTRVSLKWSYTESGTDFYVDHGKIFIEKVVRGDQILFEAEKDVNGDLVLENGIPKTITNELKKDYGVSDSAGEVFLECGDKVTVRLIPTYGYQIKEAKLNGCVPLTANEKVSSFTFTVEGNLHLAGNFVDGTDVTDTTGAEKINDAGIADGGNATNSGNLKLTVKDNSEYENATAALNLVKGENANATTIATLDMTLKSMVSKGNGQYWTDGITSFKNDIKVNLELNDTTYERGDTYVVVREHGGNLEKLTTTYSNGMLEVPTNKFSTYSIVKIPVSEEDRPNMHVIYDARGYDENTPGSVTVKDSTSTEIVGTDGYFKYDDSELKFELVKPGDRSACTPVVEVVFPQENAEQKVIKPAVTNDTFTVTLSEFGLTGSPYMEVFVWWSEYDKLEPDENQFMFIMNQPLGGGKFVFQNDLDPEASKSLGNESKYIFANGTEVSVELKPNENKELSEVFLFQGEQGIHYSGDPNSFREDPEVQRNINELKVGDENVGYKYILSGLSPWAYVDVFFIDIPVLSDITNTTGTLYDSMKGSDVSVSSTCKIGEVVIAGTTKLKDQNSYLTTGTNDYVVEFTSDPDENGKSFTVEGTISLTVVHNDVSSIDITTQPTKTSYTYGESFDKTGLVVTAHYLDNSTQNVTDYVTFEGEIVPSNTTIVVKYTRDNVTVTKNITISVSHATIDISGLGWTGETFEYNGTAQGPTFSSTLPTGVAVTSTENDSKTAKGNYVAVAYIRLDSGYPAAYYKLQDPSNSAGINVAVGGATATVSKDWSITAKNLANAQITLGDALTYNGAAQTQTIESVTVDGRTLTEGDYTVTGNTQTAAGTYTLTITGQGNYTGTVTKEWTIGKQSISNATVTLGAALTYDGTTQTQTVSSVVIGESTLTENTDYTISDNQKKDAGTYTLTVTGKGNYDGTITKEFTINTVTVTPTLTGTVTKTYDNTTTVPESNNLTLSVTGTVASDTLTVNAASYAYDDATVGNGKTITATGITISGDAAKNYTLSGTTATVEGGEITQATPTITLSGLSETTQSPTGVKATLSPADANAQVVIEYQVVDTPAVAATPEVPCNVTHDEGCASLTEGNTIADCDCAKDHTSHNSECGYQDATSGSPATYKWVTTRPTTPGTYKVRAYLPTGTTNVAAIAEANAVTGTYTLTKYTAPSGGDPNSGSGSGSNSGSGSTSSGGTTNTAPTTPVETEATTPATTENTTTATTTRRPAATTEENNEETASETKIGVASEDGAEGWTDIKTEINDKLTGALEAEEGEDLVVAVEMNGEDTVPADVFEAIEGQDITVTFDMGNGIVWTVNGMDVTAGGYTDINLGASTGEGVTSIPAELITSLVEDRFCVELTLEYEGEFGFTAVMSVYVDTEKAGNNANLFYYNPETECMEFICSAPIKEDGTADLTFTHASDYVIVVGETVMSAADNVSVEDIKEAAPQETPEEMSMEPVEMDTAENDSFNLFWIIAIGILILVVGGIVILAVNKKKE